MFTITARAQDWDNWADEFYIGMGWKDLPQQTMSYMEYIGRLIDGQMTYTPLQAQHEWKNCIVTMNFNFIDGWFIATHMAPEHVTSDAFTVLLNNEPWNLWDAMLLITND